jgi:hypothetical protein
VEIERGLLTRVLEDLDDLIEDERDALALVERPGILKLLISAEA